MKLINTGIMKLTGKKFLLMENAFKFARSFHKFDWTNPIFLDFLENSELLKTERMTAFVFAPRLQWDNTEERRVFTIC